MRYLKIGNQTATIIALCNLVDFDLTKGKYLVVKLFKKIKTSGKKCIVFCFRLLSIGNHGCRWARSLGKSA